MGQRVLAVQALRQKHVEGLTMATTWKQTVKAYREQARSAAYRHRKLHNQAAINKGSAPEKPVYVPPNKSVPPPESSCE